MDYEVAFEISQSLLGSSSESLIGFLFIAIGVIIYKKPKLFQDNWSEKASKTFVKIWLGFSIFWTVFAFGGTFISHNYSRYIYNNDKYNVIEGIVENFDPMPWSGHKMESFTVHGVKFEYSDYRNTPGFNNATSKGGPIREGLPVKISYTGNTILKLEISKNANRVSTGVTVRPWPSVNTPSSRTCNSTLNTSGCAFSTSSNSTT